MEVQHYIRIDENNNIIHGFSTAFEQPIKGDILLRNTEFRHFYIGDFIFNPQLLDYPNKPKYKWFNNEIILID